MRRPLASRLGPPASLQQAAREEHARRDAHLHRRDQWCLTRTGGALPHFKPLPKLIDTGEGQGAGRVHRLGYEVGLPLRTGDLYGMLWRCLPHPFIRRAIDLLDPADETNLLAFNVDVPSGAEAGCLAFLTGQPVAQAANLAQHSALFGSGVALCSATRLDGGVPSSSASRVRPTLVAACSSSKSIAFRDCRSYSTGVYSEAC